MKGFMILALAVLLLLPLSAVACDGGAGFAFAQPVYSQGFAVQAVPVYQQQVFSAPVYGNSFGNVFVSNRGFGFNRGFGRGFGGQQVIVNNGFRGGFNRGFNGGFSRGFGGGGNQVIINQNRGFFGRRNQIIIR